VGSSVTTNEHLLRAAEFEARRRRVLRAMAAFALATLGGVGLMLAARTFAPDDFDAGVAVFLAFFAATGLALWRTLGRHWRCPACAARWDTGDALASAHWNHCPTCGAPLRPAPAQATHERITTTQFALDDIPHDEIVSRFQRRRRRRLLGAGAVIVAGVATLVWVRDQGWGDAAEQVVVALFAGIVAAVGLTGTRCPRCQIGIVAGKARHCQRCGLLLRPDISAGAARRNGT
jgi:hypothetical protein